MIEIDQWLSGGRDYEAGCALYVSHGTSTFLKDLFAKGETYYTRIKLAEELQKVSQALKESTLAYVQQPVIKAEEESLSVPQNDTQRKKASRSLFRPDLAQLPEDVQKVYNQATHLFKENARRHAELMGHVTIALTKSSNEAADEYLQSIGSGVRVNEILMCDDELAPLYEQINYYEEHGKLPELPSIPTVDLTSLEMITELRNKRSFVSKQKNNTARAGEVAEARERIIVLEENLKRIE